MIAIIRMMTMNKNNDQTKKEYENKIKLNIKKNW